MFPQKHFTVCAICSTTAIRAVEISKTCGRSSDESVVPLRPFWPPLFFPDFLRRLFGDGFLYQSEEGGFDELDEFLDNRPSRSSIFKVSSSTFLDKTLTVFVSITSRSAACSGASAINLVACSLESSGMTFFDCQSFIGTVYRKFLFMSGFLFLVLSGCHSGQDLFRLYLLCNSPGTLSEGCGSRLEQSQVVSRITIIRLMLWHYKDKI
jgi:hypothetical protein